jgi:cupin fold WbuC family metalloprotein
MKRVTHDDLAALSAEARTAARRRKNLNLHSRPDDPVQRLLNALEPGTYVRPHRHTAPAKWELMAVIAGRAVLLVFDDNGVARGRTELDASTPLVEIPPGTWHALAALESGTVLLEVKEGPYLPTAPEDFAPWAPDEGTDAARTLERWFVGAHPGDAAPT